MVFLINPSFERREKCNYFSKWIPITFPVGIANLASYLIKQQKVVKIIDDNINLITEQTLPSFVDNSNICKPYIFGISCVTANIMRGYEIAKIIKAVYPDSKVIIGGMHPTVLPEEALNTGVIDIVVRREGEEILDQLSDCIVNKKSYNKVLGISFKKGNKIIHNKDAPVLKNIDFTIPYPYHLFEENINRYDLGFVMTSRGCPYDCIFCSARSISGKSYRYIEPQKVIEQLDLLVNKYNQKNKYIAFIDDNFVINKEWTKKVCELMSERKYYKKVKFSCSLRSDGVDEEVLISLKKAGFTLINLGIETVSDRLLKIIKKNETVEAHTKAVKLIRKYGIKVGGTFIFGLPTETKEERVANYKWAKKYLDFARFNNPSPYPGTELYEIGKKEGRLNVGENWEHLNPVAGLVENPVLPYVPTTCTEEELRKDVFGYNYSFWLRPSKVSLLVFERSPLWFSLPPRWYFDLHQWYDLSRLGGKVISNVFKQRK